MLYPQHIFLLEGISKAACVFVCCECLDSHRQNVAINSKFTCLDGLSEILLSSKRKDHSDSIYHIAYASTFWWVQYRCPHRSYNSSNAFRMNISIRNMSKNPPSDYISSFVICAPHEPWHRGMRIPTGNRTRKACYTYDSLHSSDVLTFQCHSRCPVYGFPLALIFVFRDLLDG